MSYSRSYKSNSYRFSADDDGPSSFTASSSRYSSNLSRDNVSSSLNRSSLLGDLDSNLLSSSSTRKKLRSDYDNLTSFDYGHSTASGSGYGSSRRFEPSSALSNYGREVASSSLLSRKNYLDEEDEDYTEKYSPRRLGMLSGRQQSSTNNTYKKYLDDDDEDNDISISSSVYKRTKYNKTDDYEDKDESYSIRNIRKHSSSSNTSYLKDDPDQFYSELISKTSSRYKNKKDDDYDSKDEDFQITSRFSNKQSSKDDRKYLLEDDYMPNNSSVLKNLSRLSSKEESSGNSKSTSRFLSKYSSRDEPQDDEIESNSRYSSQKKSYSSRFNSREDLNKEDDSANGKEFTTRYKKYSRQESAGATSILSERSLNLPESCLETKNEKTIETKSFSSSSYKTSRLYEDSDGFSQQNIASTSLETKTSFLDKENQSKSYLEDENSTLDAKESAYYVIIDYNPPKSSPDEIPLKEGQRVTVLSKDKPNKWRIQTHNFKDVVGTVGFAPSCYLEPLEDAIPGLSKDSSSKDSSSKSFSVQQAEKKRKTIIKELVETEEDFNRDMQFIANTYLKHMESSLMPKELRENRCELYNYFRQIADFHNNELSKAIQFYSQEESKNIESAFLRMEREFDLHVAYCRDLPEVQQMLKEGPFKDYFDNYSSKIKDDKKLEDHLKLPVQRINDYQLLIKELIKYTARLNENTKDLEKALEMMQAIPQRANDLQFIQSIQGYRGNLHDTGRLLKQDWFKVIGNDNKAQDRYCILFKQKLLITDQQNAGQGKKIYFIKNLFKLNEIKASSDDDELVIILNRKGGEITSDLPIKLKATSIEQKTKWLDEIHNCRQLTREELADEREPEFTIIEDDSKKSFSRRDSLDSNKSLSLLNKKNETVLEDKLITVVKLEDPKEDDETSLSGLKKSPSKQSLNNSSFSRNNSLKIEDAENIDTNKEETLVRKPSRDLPEGLPKPQKIEQKLNSLSRQSSKQDLNRKLSVSSNVEVNEQPLSRQNSSLENKTSSRLSSRKSSVEKPNSESANLSRKNSTIDDKSETSLDKKSLSRESSRKSSFPKRQESKVLEDFEVYEESKNVPLVDEESPSRKVIWSENEEKPKFKRELKDVKVNFNETILLECELEPIKEKVVLEWLKDNKVLNIAGRYKSSNEGNVYCLQINKAIVRDSGVFALTATSPYAQTITTANVIVKPLERQDSRPSTPGGTVLPHAPIFKIKLKDTDVLENSTIRFELLVTGDPAPKISFFKDEKPLKEDEKIKVEYQSNEAFEIVIENIKPSDAGHYRVLAQNSEGTDSTSCNLTVSSEKEVFKGLVDNEDENVLLSPNLEKNESLSRKSSNSNSRPRTPLFKWFKDGNEFNASDRFLCQFNEDEDTIGLIFQHVTPEDAGLYTCVAKTGTMNKISCSAELTVQGEVNRLLRDPEPPKFLESLKDSTVSKGSTATIEVKVTGYPKPVISWIHDDQEIKFPSDKHKLLYEDDDTMTLIIKNAQPEDAGTYQLVAKNELGEVSDDCKLTVQSPPKFMQKLDDQNVLKNKPFELSVKIQSSPEPEIQWLKNDKPLTKENSPNIKFECKKDNDIYTFTAKCDSADFDDAGSYSVVTQLTVPNDYAPQSCKCSVSVNAEPQISGFKNFTGNEEDNLELKITITGSPKPTVQLFKNGKPVDLNNEKNIKLINEGNDSYKLVFPKLNKDQCANYTLVAKNEFGENKADARLDIKSKPEFTQKLSDLTGKEGENANLVVKVKGFPTPDIVFKFNDKPVDLNNKDKYNLKIDDDGTITLEIKDLKPSDAGKYSVEVKNSEGKIESDCKLQINSPPKFTLPLKNVVINENEKLILKVKYSGSPKPELTWFKNDKKLKTDDKRIKINEKTDDKGETECELIITGSISTDSAKYKCKAKNISGEVSTDCDALVSAMPIFIQGLTNVDATDGQKDVEFSVKLKRQPNEPAVKWFLGDLSVKEDDDRFTLIKPNRNKEPISEEDGDEYKLIIKTATTDLASMVKCEARNQFGVSECYASFTVKKAPHFIENLEDVKYGEINKTVKLQVKASGFPKPNLKWKRNNIEEEFTSATIILKENCIPEKGEDIVTSTIEIKSLTLEFCGDFECVASNEMGEVITKGKLKIGSKPKVLKDLENVSGNIGEKIVLEFKALGEPMPEFTWYKDGKKINNDGNFTIEVKDDGTCKLNVNLSDPNLEGNYNVVAKNPVGETESKKITLNVIDPSENKNNKVELDDENKNKKDDSNKNDKNKPELEDENKDKSNDKNKSMGKSIDSFDTEGKDSRIPKIHDLTDVGVKIGEPITLLAFVTGKPEAEVSWFKSGISINSTDNIVLLKGEEAFNNLDSNTKNYIKSNPIKGVLHTLTVKKVVEDNLGDYTLKASNKYGDAEKTVQMQLKSTSPIFLSELPNSVKVKEGTKLRLEAKIDGNPTPCVKWFKNGREIVTNNLNDQLNRLTDPSLSSNDDVDNNKDNKKNNRKDSFASTKEPSFDKHRSRRDSLASVGSLSSDKKLKRLNSQSKSIDDSNQQSDLNLVSNATNVNKDEAGFYSSNKAVGGGDHVPNYCVSSNDIFINDRIKIENFANGICILTIDKAKDEDEGIYTIMAVNKNAQATSNCRVNVVSKYYREYSPPASVKHKMQSDPNYKPPIEWGLKGRKPNDHFDFKSETNYQIGSDTYVLQYRDTSFPLRIREYLRVGSARSPSLASNLKEGHWGFAHPDTGFYPSVSVRERRKFTDVMDEEIKDEKTGETIRKQPLRLIREIPTSGRGYGQVVTLRSEVARADSKEEADEDVLTNITDQQKQNNEAQSVEDQSIAKKRKLKSILKSEIPYFREKIKDTTANEEETIKFKCFAVGDPKPGYTWFKNDHLLMDDTKITIHYNPDGRSELEIRDINEYDYGRYKCLARNDHGAVVCQAILKPPNHIISIPNEDTQIELDYLVETDSIRKKAILKEEELYSFNNILFKGKYSLVLKGTEKSTNKQVVCKTVLDKDLQESGFNNELKILSTLCHERIVLLSSAARFKGINVIAMEQLSGINVITYLSLQPTYTEALITKIISQVTDAIEYLHFRGIALLELQPDNVVMVNASQPFIKLVDFSNARYVSSKGEDGIEVKGNDAYLAPEVLLKQRITYAADIWCIGVLSYILLSGHNPFIGETEKETRDNVCFVRFNYNQVFKQTSQEAIRFLMFIFKKDAEKRPKIEEVQNNKWLFCDENLIKKREAVIFSGTLLNAFTLEFHSEKERNSPDELAKICGV